MAYAYVIDRQRRLVIGRAYGRLTEDDIVAARARLTIDPSFDPHYRQLIDLRGATTVPISDEQLARLAGPMFAPGTRRAIVIARGEHRALAELFERLAAEHRQVVQVFTDYREAEAWVDADIAPTT